MGALQHSRRAAGHRRDHLCGGSLAFADLDRAEPATTNVLEGWGIHLTMRHGWLWNVWGFRAVKFVLRNGRRVTLGTDDPQGLLTAIQRFR